MKSDSNHNQKALIIGSCVFEIDSVSEMEYILPKKKWSDVVIKLKSEIPFGLICEETQIIYILKDGNLFHVKPCSTVIENNCLTIVPKSCGLLIQNISEPQKDQPLAIEQIKFQGMQSFSEPIAEVYTESTMNFTGNISGA